LTTVAATRLQVARYRQDGAIKEANAEETYANNLQAKRKHEQRLRKSQSLQSLMRDKKVIIGGKNGQELLDYFSETTDLVDSLDE
jgi:hypothetical protein